MQVKSIIRAAAHIYGFEPKQLTGLRRGKELCFARHVAMHVVFGTRRHSLPQIGRFFGNRDHTTVLHGHRKIGAMAAMSVAIATEVDRVRALAADLDAGRASIPKPRLVVEIDAGDEYQDTTSIAATEKPLQPLPALVATVAPKKEPIKPERRLRLAVDPSEKLARMNLDHTSVGSRLWCEIQNARFFRAVGYPYTPTIEVRQ